MDQKNPFSWRHFKKRDYPFKRSMVFAFSLTYRDLEEMMWERGLKVDHTAIY